MNDEWINCDLSPAKRIFFWKLQPNLCVILSTTKYKNKIEWVDFPLYKSHDKEKFYIKIMI